MTLLKEMEGAFLMLKLRAFFVFIIFSINLYAIDVLVTTAKINYKEKIDIKKLSSAKVLSVKKYCIPLTIQDIESKKYVAKRYLRKGTVLCASDVKEYSKKSVLFNFGLIEIEKEGKIIFENDEYIRIKKPNGKIEKIFKDGSVR